MPPPSGRTILFLQGPSSPFFRQTAHACRNLGARVLRLCLCPGDRLYWSSRLGTTLHFRDPPERFAERFAQTLASEGVTDVVMLGDGRFYHATALEVLAQRSECARRVRPWIVEHGYLRPGLIRVETPDIGVGPAVRLRFAAEAQPPSPVATDGALPRSAPFLHYAMLDIGFHASNLALGWLTHPHYQHHALDGPIREYVGWIAKGLIWPVRAWQLRQGLRQIEQHPGPVFLLPLQLATDFQIRLYGTGDSLPGVVEAVVDSFARAAPRDSLLVVKEHPLDNGLIDWRRLLLRYARARGVAARVVYLAGGDLALLLDRSQGVITVNSTVGLTALRRGVACHVLGRAVYDLPGLTDPQPLDQFWSRPRPPDHDLLKRFVAFLLHSVHVVGGFDGPAAQIGARRLAERLLQLGEVA